MTITIDTKKIFLGLFGVLVILYGVNIYNTNKLYTGLVDEPVELDFVVIDISENKCQECADPDQVIKVIDSSHNIDYKIKTLDSTEEIAQNYIRQYNIQNLPAVIVMGDIENKKITGAWKALPTKQKSDAVVIENLLPYYNIASETVNGVVDITLLTDESCDNCFDEKLYLNIFKQFGIKVGQITSYDLSSDKGRELVSKYSIDKLPTVLVSPEVKVYKRLVDTWSQVGTRESDGWLVLREVQKLTADYKTLN